MTNEQLAEFIKQGDNDELLPLLWEKTHRLVYMHCSRLYSGNIERFKRHGIDEWDLKQSAYEGFLKAIEAYNPEKGYKFSTYLPYSIRNVVRGLIGVSGGKETDLLNICDSLDCPIAEDNETELIETIPDEAASVPFEDLERKSTGEAVRREVEKLPEKQRHIVKSLYFENRTLNEVGKDLGVSVERVRQIKQTAFKQLKRSKELQQLKGYTIGCQYRSAAACQRWGSTVETTVEKRAELQEEIDKILKAQTETRKIIEELQQKYTFENEET